MVSDSDLKVNGANLYPSFRKEVVTPLVHQLKAMPEHSGKSVKDINKIAKQIYTDQGIWEKYKLEHGIINKDKPTIKNPGCRTKTNVDLTGWAIVSCNDKYVATWESTDGTKKQYKLTEVVAAKPSDPNVPKRENPLSLFNKSPERKIWYAEFKKEYEANPIVGVSTAKAFFDHPKTKQYMDKYRTVKPTENTPIPTIKLVEEAIINPVQI